MIQGILQSDPASLADLKAEHLKTLSAPLDAYWEEALIGFADHYEIQIDSERSGFYCVNGDHQLVAFHLSPTYAPHGEDALAHIIQEHGVSAALAGTNDPFFLSLCLDIATRTSVHTLLFQDHQKASDKGSETSQHTFSRATEEDFADLFEHYRAASGSMDVESIETGFEDLKGYIRSVLDKHHIFVLRKDGELVGTSECRISKTQKPYADVGMIVAAAHRRKGIGGSILARTKEFCYAQGVRPICSCEASNIGSKKAISKAGFVSRHRIVQMEFDVQ
jgi:predicted acetyltransferase